MVTAIPHRGNAMWGEGESAVLCAGNGRDG